MAGEYVTDIKCDVQSLINDAIMIEFSLNNKNILLAYHHVKHTVVETIMIMTKTREYLAYTFINR